MSETVWHVADIIDNQQEVKYPGEESRRMCNIVLFLVSSGENISYENNFCK